MTEPTVTPRQVLVFWAPLAATWLMMAAEGPFVAALIARLGDPAHNLAAFGVALSFAMLIEAPIIMVMSAATALVRDLPSLLALRRFTYALNGIITVVMAGLLAPPVFELLAERLIRLPAEVARLAYLTTLAMLPWPAAIGYRRFYQGVMIRHGRTRRVAYGTVVRLAGMAVVGGVLFALDAAPGAVVGGLALSTGVLLEAAASRVMAAGSLRAVRREPGSGEGLTTAAIARFYLPLALTSLLTLGAHPLVTFLLGRSRLALASLAVLPVLNSLVFLLRSPAFAYQEVVIALLGAGGEGERVLRRVATVLGALLTGALALIAWTPLGTWWLERVAGLPPELVSLAIWPLRMLSALPALEVLISFQRARLVVARATRPITVATALEVLGIAVLLLAATRWLDWVGVVAAAAALVVARTVATAFLLGASRRRRPALTSG